MALLTEKCFSVEFIPKKYYWAKQHETDEYYYDCKIMAHHQPILLSVFDSQTRPIFDFEIDDEKLSDMFVSAIKDQSKKYLGSTYCGGFDLSISPTSLDNQWEVCIEIGPHYFELGHSHSFDLKIGFNVSQNQLTTFCEQLIAEENAIFFQS